MYGKRLVALGSWFRLNFFLTKVQILAGKSVYYVKDEIGIANLQ